MEIGKTKLRGSLFSSNPSSNFELLNEEKYIKGLPQRCHKPIIFIFLCGWCIIEAKIKQDIGITLTLMGNSPPTYRLCLSEGPTAHYTRKDTRIKPFLRQILYKEL